MIFDKTSIRPKFDSQSINLTSASNNKVTLRFPSFYFSYISWVDDDPAISFPQPVTILSPSLPLSVLPDLPSNSNIDKDNENISFDFKDELSLPLLSLKQSLTPQTQ